MDPSTIVVIPLKTKKLELQKIQKKVMPSKHTDKKANHARPHQASILFAHADLSKYHSTYNNHYANMPLQHTAIFKFVKRTISRSIIMTFFSHDGNMSV